MSTEHDDKLWKIARRRAAFKRHLTTYVLVNLFFWAIWWFTGEQRHYRSGSIPWPIWPMLGWGLGLAFNYFSAYGAVDKHSAIESEYKKLKSESERTNS